jgi:DNA-binding NarL/FixJ family response regulator
MAMSQEHKATAVVIDDHPGALRAASEIMQAEFEILATSSNSEVACDIVTLFHPDIAVLDIAMPAKDGFEIARQMRERHLPTLIIFLTAEEDDDYASAARDMGASYVVKRRMSIDLVIAAKEAMEGKLFSSPVSLAHLKKMI